MQLYRKGTFRDSGLELFPGKTSLLHVGMTVHVRARDMATEVCDLMVVLTFPGLTPNRQPRHHVHDRIARNSIDTGVP